MLSQSGYSCAQRSRSICAEGIGLKPVAPPQLVQVDPIPLRHPRCEADIAVGDFEQFANGIESHVNVHAGAAIRGGVIGCVDLAAPPPSKPRATVD